MGKYLTKFETNAAYDAAKDGLVKPNVSYIVEGNDVEYNPYIPPRMDIITYTASAKLAETTSSKNSGLHTNAFNTTIKSHTFENGVGTIEFNDDVTSIGQYAFYDSKTLTSIEIPSGVTSIGGWAFQYCTSLRSITIPDNVTSIGTYAFLNCSGLASITIPNSVTSIGDYAFSTCTGLTSCTIGNSVTSIGSAAFGECSSLTSVTIGSGVTSIGSGAFVGCSGLTSITSLATTAPTIQSNTFRAVKTDGTLYVPSGSSGYDVWMGTGDYYLGFYNWTKVEQ